MEEIVKLIPFLLIAVIFEPSIILFIILPPVLFGFVFSFIEWASQSFSLLSMLDTFQIALFTSFTALISEFAPLLMTGVTLSLIRRYYQPTSWQLGIIGAAFEGIYATAHLHLFSGHTSDIAIMVSIMAGVGAYMIDTHQKEKGIVPMSLEQLRIKSETSSDFGSVNIQTDRLDLKSLEMSYALPIFKEFTPEVTRYMSIKAPMVPAESEEFTKHAIKNMKRGYELVLIINDTKTGFFLGLCGIHARTNASEPELGIWLGEDAQGKGYGKETIDALVNWGSEHLVCDNFTYVVSEHNIPSRSVAETNGAALAGKRSVGAGNSILEMLVYTIPLRQPDPMISHASLVLWSNRSAETEDILYTPLYRLTKTKDIRPENTTNTILNAYEIHGSNLFINNGRIQQRPKAWIEAGDRIKLLIDEPGNPVAYCNKDAAMALSISQINSGVDDLISIELISAVALDPVGLTVTNRQDPLAPIIKVAAIPDNYYVFIFNINGRHKYIHHIRSNGQFVFEDVHTMGNAAKKKNILTKKTYLEDDTIVQ